MKEPEKIQALKLLKMQRHCMLMYTSCGWFFDEVSGLETVQILQYASRAMQLARELFGTDLEPYFLELLERARSNVPEFRNGRRVYEKLVRGAVVDLEKVGAHYALSSLFNDFGDVTRTYAFTVRRHGGQEHTAGRARLSLGRARVVSDVTRESAELMFAAVRFGEHSVSGGVQRFHNEETYQGMLQDISAAFENADFPGLIRLLDRDFAPGGISLRYLFRDEQRRILGQILEESVLQAETMYRNLYADRAPLMRFATTLGIPLPAAVRFAAEVTLNTDLRKCFELDVPDLRKIDSLLLQARKAGVTVESNGLEPAVRSAIERTAIVFRDRPGDLASLETLNGLIRIARKLPFAVNLRNPQNWFFQISRSVYPEVACRSAQSANGDTEWVERFQALGQSLSVVVGC